KVLGRAIRTVRGEALGLEAEALGGPVEHGARGADLGLTDRPARLDIEDDRVVGVDQVVGGIGEEGVALVGAGPLRRRVGRRDELRGDLASSTEGGIVESSQILTDGVACFGSRRIDLPLLPWYGALLVGVGGD